MTIRRLFVAAIALPLCLVACASNDKPKPAPAPAPAPATTTPPKTTTPAPTPAPAHAQAAPENDTPRVSRTGMKFRFGIMPGNYEDDKEGVDVGDVYPHTSAGDAGILKGDRLMTWNGSKIIDVQDWMEKMAPHKSGDVVEVGVLRDGKIIPIKVTLKAAE